MKSQPEDIGANNQQSGKKEKEKMNMKLLLKGIDERNQKGKKVFL